MRKGAVTAVVVLVAAGVACAQVNQMAQQAENAASNAVQQVASAAQNMTLLSFTMSLEKFDSQSNTFTTLPAPPTKRNGLKVASAGGKLVIFGGVDEKRNRLDSTDVFDLKAATWKSGAAASTNDRDPKVEGSLICFTGPPPGSPSTATIAPACYDTTNDTFGSPGGAGSQANTFGSGRFSYDVTNGTGTDAGAADTTTDGGAQVWTDHRVRDATTGTWSAVPTPPLPTFNVQRHVEEQIGDKLYVMFQSADGTSDNKGPFTSVSSPMLAYDPTTKTWTQGKTLAPIKYPSALNDVVAGDRIYVVSDVVVGDMGPSGLGIQAIYDTSKDTWTVPSGDAGKITTKVGFEDILLNKTFALGGKLYALLLAEAFEANNSGHVLLAQPDGSWSVVAQHPPVPNATTLLYSTTVVDDQLYLVGVATALTPH